MRISKIYTSILILFLLSISSCNIINKNANINCKTAILGKWYRFSMENGYTEFDIDSLYVTFYNHKVGRYKLPYTIKNDSFKYLTHKYAAKIKCYDDSIYLEGNDGTKATLIKFKNPPFDSIPDEFKDSIVFEQYYAGFKERLIKAFEKAGFVFFDRQENTENNVNQEDFERLMKLRNIK